MSSDIVAAIVGSVVTVLLHQQNAIMRDISKRLTRLEDFVMTRPHR